MVLITYFTVLGDHSDYDSLIRDNFQQYSGDSMLCQRLNLGQPCAKHTPNSCTIFLITKFD